MKIVLGTFKDNADELAEFLGPRLGAKAAVAGGELSFDDDEIKKTIRSRHVKTYVKRFLNRKGERHNYQVLVEGNELRMIELEREEEEEKTKEKKAKPEKEEAEEAKKDEATEDEGGASPVKEEAK